MSANHSLAVEAWIEHFPALLEFSAHRPFFKHMMKEIAKTEVTKITPGKVLECAKKTSMSIADLATDIITIGVFQMLGRHTVARILLVIVFTSYLFQIGICVLIHHRNARIMWQEMLYTTAFLKSGINHFRVITKAELRGHELVDSSIEKAMFVGIELCVESLRKCFACAVYPICLSLTLALTQPPFVVANLQLAQSFKSTPSSCTFPTLVGRPTYPRPSALFFLVSTHSTSTSPRTATQKTAPCPLCSTDYFPLPAVGSSLSACSSSSLRSVSSSRYFMRSCSLSG